MEVPWYIDRFAPFDLDALAKDGMSIWHHRRRSHLRMNDIIVHVTAELIGSKETCIELLLPIVCLSTDDLHT